MGHCPTGGNWYKSPTANTDIPSQSLLDCLIFFNVEHIRLNVDNPTILTSSITHRAMLFSLICIVDFFSQSTPSEELLS